MHLLESTSFWVLLAVIAFAALFWVKGRGPLLAMLDKRSAKIKSALDEAERLKAEAQKLLAESQRQQRDAQATAQKILTEAQAAANDMQKTAEKKLVADIERRERQLMERISRAEAQAVQDIRREAATLATAAAERLLDDVMQKQGGKLVDEAVVKIASARV